MGAHVTSGEGQIEPGFCYFQDEEPIVGKKLLKDLLKT